MRAADLGGGAEQVGVALQLPVAAAEHVAREHHARVGGAAHAVDVLGRVRRAAHHHQLHALGLGRRDPRPRLDQHVRVVLGLQPAHEQHVAARLQAQALQHVAAAVLGQLGAVGHDPDAAPVARLVDARHGVRVGDRPGGQPRRQPLGGAQVGLGHPVPLAPVGVQAVHVDHGGDAGGAGDQAQRAVAGDEEQRHVGLDPARRRAGWTAACARTCPGTCCAPWAGAPASRPSTRGCRGRPRAGGSTR